MTPGKLGAQTAHAAVEAFQISDPKLLEDWYLGGHYCKLVMSADDDTHLMIIKTYIEERGFKTKLIIDEGHTEIRPHSATALGVEVVDRDDLHTAATFGDFKLYKEMPYSLKAIGLDDSYPPRRDRPKISTSMQGGLWKHRFFRDLLK